MEVRVVARHERQSEIQHSRFAMHVTSQDQYQKEDEDVLEPECLICFYPLAVL